MELSKEQSIIEAMLFAAGREVSVKEFTNALELGAEDIDKIILNMKAEYENRNSGIEIIKVNDSYQLCTRKEYYEYSFSNRCVENVYVYEGGIVEYVEYFFAFCSLHFISHPLLYMHRMVLQRLFLNYLLIKLVYTFDSRSIGGSCSLPSLMHLMRNAILFPRVRMV